MEQDPRSYLLRSGSYSHLTHSSITRRIEKIWQVRLDTIREKTVEDFDWEWVYAYSVIAQSLREVPFQTQFA